MDKQINKIILIAILLSSICNKVYSLEKVSCYMKDNRVLVSDSVHFTIKNEYADTLYIVKSILFHKEQSDICYRSYLEDWELYKRPVKLSDKFKYSPYFIPIPPKSEKEISFFINQPYITRKEDVYIYSYESKDIKTGNFLLELRVCAKNKTTKNPSYMDTLILPIFRY